MSEFLPNPSFYDHFRRRSEKTERTYLNTEDLTLGFPKIQRSFVSCINSLQSVYMCSIYRNRCRYNSLRYAGRDYSRPGKYFVTICTAVTKEWFGNVINSKMHLSEIGQIASEMWREIPVHFPFIGLDAFVVMPDHIHGIIVINRSIITSIVGALHATPYYNMIQHTR